MYVSDNNLIIRFMGCSRQRDMHAKRYLLSCIRNKKET